MGRHGIAWVFMGVNGYMSVPVDDAVPGRRRVAGLGKVGGRTSPLRGLAARGEDPHASVVWCACPADARPPRTIRTDPCHWPPIQRRRPIRSLRWLAAPLVWTGPAQWFGRVRTQQPLAPPRRHTMHPNQGHRGGHRGRRPRGPTMKRPRSLIFGLAGISALLAAAQPSVAAQAHNAIGPQNEPCIRAVDLGLTG